MSGPVSLFVLQSGPLGLPDEPIYWIPSLLLLLGLVGILYIIRPPVTDWTAASFAPWIAVGAVLHTMRLQPIVPDSLDPLFGAPAIYLTTATTTLAVWSISQLFTDMRPPGASNDRQMSLMGIFALVLLVIAAIWSGTNNGTIRPLWPVIGFFFSAVGAAVVWVALSLGFTDSAASTGKTGALVVFAHILEGVTVLVGKDLLDPPRLGSPDSVASTILNIGDALAGPIPLIPGSLLYVLVKFALAAVVIVAFKRIVDEAPTAGRLGLLFVAAAGLGPAVHNLVLFTVIESTPYALLGPLVAIP